MYFVYYDVGRCNEGDHSCGLNEYATRQEADIFVLAMQGYVALLGGVTIIINGTQEPE